MSYVEIYMYVSPAGERVAFAEVVECARLLKQTAIGYIKADGQILLVPEPEHIFRYQVRVHVLCIGAVPVRALFWIPARLL